MYFWVIFKTTKDWLHLEVVFVSLHGAFPLIFDVKSLGFPWPIFVFLMRCMVRFVLEWNDERIKSWIQQSSSWVIIITIITIIIIIIIIIRRRRRIKHSLDDSRPILVDWNNSILVNWVRLEVSPAICQEGTESWLWPPTTFQNINLNISHFNILNADFYAKFCKFSIKGHFTWNHPKSPLPMHSSKGSRPRTSSFKHSRRSSFHKLKRWLWLWKISMIPDPQDVKFPLEIIAIMFILIKESFGGSQNIFHWRSLNAISKATINRIIDLSIGALHDVKKWTLALNLGDFLKRFVGITVWWIGEGCWFTMGNFDLKGIVPPTQLFQAKPLNHWYPVTVSGDSSVISPVIHQPNKTPRKIFFWGKNLALKLVINFGLTGFCGSVSRI